MKVIANKAAYKKATITGGGDVYKNNLSSWATNERKLLLNYVNDEFRGEGITRLLNEQMSNGANVTIEDTSALLCVVAYYRSELEKAENERDLSYNKLCSVFNAAKKSKALYYINVDSEIDAEEILNNYFYPLNASPDVSGNKKAYDSSNGVTIYARQAYPIDDQDNYQYAPNSI